MMVTSAITRDFPPSAVLLNDLVLSGPGQRIFVGHWELFGDHLLGVDQWQPTSRPEMFHEHPSRCSRVLAADDHGGPAEWLRLQASPSHLRPRRNGCLVGSQTAGTSPSAQKMSRRPISS